MKYGKFDVYIDGETVGEVDISGDGLLTCFVCKVQYSGGEVMRLAADVGDAYEVIGVVMPDGDGFGLKKYLTKNDIYIKRLDNAQKYVLISKNAKYESFHRESLPEKEEEADRRVWTVCQDPVKYFDDKEAGEAVAQWGGALKAELDGCVYIALPVKSEETFPPLPIFYFGQHGKLGENEYLLFTLKNGMLQI